MKTRMAHGFLAALLSVGVGGCISIPPLIKVEHKSDKVEQTKSNDDILKRLDSIERRLDRLADQMEKR